MSRFIPHLPAEFEDPQPIFYEDDLDTGLYEKGNARRALDVEPSDDENNGE